MAFLVIAMLLATGLAAVVVGVVAIPAHREGRGMLTTKGEGILTSARQRLRFARRAH